jgi:hypothetical protein
VRNNPEHFANVIWVYQLSPKVLKEELREAPLSEIGEWGELARRLAEHVRGYLTDYSSIIEQGVSSRARSEDPIKAVVESRKSPPLEIVRKWNLKFGPQDSVYSFLERLDELKSAYNVLGGDMLLAIPELLKGSVVLWYRNNHSNFASWQNFLTAFKERYLPLDVDDALWDDIQSRTQGAGESVADYVMSVRILLRRLTTTPSSQQL